MQLHEYTGFIWFKIAISQKHRVEKKDPEGYTQNYCLWISMGVKYQKCNGKVHPSLG
jgi:hypothetical protein